MYSLCSKDCNGTQSRKRMCKTPLNELNRTSCSGMPVESQSCNKQKCEGNKYYYIY